MRLQESNLLQIVKEHTASGGLAAPAGAYVVPLSRARSALLLLA